MLKRIIGQHSPSSTPAQQQWLDLETLAHVELSSEDPSRPVESALLPEGGEGWRAAEPGPQTLRLLFEKPLPLKRIHLLFTEKESSRTQEFVLRWSSDRGENYREIVRQQYNFSPPDTTEELEEYDVELSGVTALELKIIPNISGGKARASLTELRVA